MEKWALGLDDSAQEGRERHLLEALLAFSTIEMVSDDLLRRVARSDLPRARALAARIAGRWSDRIANPLNLLALLARDKNPRVRMEAVLAAGQIPQMNSIKVVALASEQEMDRSIEYAFTQAVHHLKPYWEEAFAEGHLVFRKSSQLAAILSLAGSRNTLNRLRKVADSGDLSLKERRGAMISLLALGGPREFRDYGLDQAAFTQSGQYDAESHAILLSRLVEEAEQRIVKPEGELRRLLLPLIDSEHEELTRQALILAGLWSVRELGPHIARKARDKSLSLALRSASFLSLAQIKSSETPEILARFSDRGNLPDVPASAIRAMCLTDIHGAAERAATLIAEGGLNQGNAHTLLRAFLSRPLGERSLVEALRASAPDRASARGLRRPSTHRVASAMIWTSFFPTLPTQVVKLFPQIMGISMNWSAWRGRKGIPIVAKCWPTPAWVVTASGPQGAWLGQTLVLSAPPSTPIVLWRNCSGLLGR